MTPPSASAPRCFWLKFFVDLSLLFPILRWSTVRDLTGAAKASSAGSGDPLASVLGAVLANRGGFLRPCPIQVRSCDSTCAFCPCSTTAKRMTAYRLTMRWRSTTYGTKCCISSRYWEAVQRSSRVSRIGSYSGWLYRATSRWMSSMPLRNTDPRASTMTDQGVGYIRTWQGARGYSEMCGSRVFGSKQYITMSATHDRRADEVGPRHREQGRQPRARFKF